SFRPLYAYGFTWSAARTQCAPAWSVIVTPFLQNHAEARAPRSNTVARRADILDQMTPTITSVANSRMLTLAIHQAPNCAGPLRGPHHTGRNAACSPSGLVRIVAHG